MKSRILVIAEKPSVTREFVSALEPNAAQKKEGDVIYYEGQRYVFASARGHLLNLAEPEEYDEKFKKWMWETLPIIPQKIKHTVIKGCNKEFALLKKLLNSPFDFVVNACDAGREGELIFRRIYLATGSKLPIKRLWLSAFTNQTIKKGFENLVDGSEYQPLFEAAYCRALFDWELGINASRAMSLATKTTINIGRVMTPTLAMVVAREKEIQNFKPVPYYQIKAIFGDLYSGLCLNRETPNFSNPQDAESILAKIQGKTGIIRDIKEEIKTFPPPMLLNLAELQKEANKRWGYSASKTLEIAQKLYEEQKILSYPRTESRHLAAGQRSEIPKILNILKDIPKIGAIATKLIANPEIVKKSLMNKRYVDDLKVTDHHALLPTDKKPDLNILTEEERDIYLFVVMRFLAIFFPSARYRHLEVLTNVGDYTFISKGKALTEPGWKTLLPDKKEAEDLPEGLQINQVYPVTSAEILSKETEPPKRYDDASLISAMQNPKVEDKEAQEILKDVSGLGTSATRAEIVEKLIRIRMLERKGKSIIPTQFGIQVIENIPVEQIKSPVLTAQWEGMLRQIENRELNTNEFLKKMLQYIKLVVEKSKEVQPSQITASIQTKKSNKSSVKETNYKCPLCGGKIIENSAAYCCSNWRNNCKLTIWKEFSGAKITKTILGEILKNGRSNEMEFTWQKTSKKGKARLVLKDGKLTFDFGA